MTQSEPVTHWVYQCDDIIIEPHTHRLVRANEEISVEPKAYAVLVTLLENAGEVVEKDTLLDAAWGHRHVTLGVLTHAISQLRQALGDSAAEPRYITTVHTLGYRFVGHVQRHTVNGAPNIEFIDDTVTAADNKPPPRSSPARPWLWLIAPVAALAVLLLVIVLSHWRRPHPSATASPPVVAVLPMTLQPAVASLQPEMDGLTESLIDQLAVQTGLRVVPKERVMHLAGVTIDPGTAAKKLDANFVLMSRLEKQHDGNLQLTLQLVSAGINDPEPWTHRYPLTLLSLSTLAATVVDDVVGALPSAPSVGPRAEHIDSDAASDNYWLAQRDWYQFSGNSDLDAIRHDKKALAADPGHAPAWCQLADSYLSLAEGGVIAMEVARAHAASNIQRGLALQPTSAECHASQGKLYVLSGNFAAAEQELRRAIALNPDLMLPRFWLGSMRLAQQQPRHALNDAMQAITERPQMYPLWLNIAISAAILGDRPKAQAALQRLRENNEPESILIPSEAWVAQNYGDLAQAARALASLTRNGQPARPSWWLYQARVYLKMDALSEVGPALNNAAESSNADFWQIRALLFMANNDPGNAVDFLSEIRPTPASAALAQAVLAHALALEGQTDEAIATYRRVFGHDFTHGEPFLGIEDFDLGPYELVNYAAVLPEDDPTRPAIIDALQRQLQQLRTAGVALPNLTYREAMLFALRGKNDEATRLLAQAIEQGFRDGPALRCDLAWTPLARNAKFVQQQQRLANLLSIERDKALPSTLARKSAATPRP